MRWYIGARAAVRCASSSSDGPRAPPHAPRAARPAPPPSRGFLQPQLKLPLRLPPQVRTKPGFKVGSKVGLLQEGEEVRVLELHSSGAYLRIGSMGTWREGLEPRGWVPVASMELAVQSSLEGKENATSPCLAKKKRQKSFVSPAKIMPTSTQTPRPTSDGLLAAQRTIGAASLAPTLFDDCGRPSSHPEHGAPGPTRTLSDNEVEVCFETRGSLGIAFCKQAGKVVIREVIAGSAADQLRHATSSSAGAAHGLRPGMVLRSVQGQPVAALGFAASMSLLSSAPRPLSLEFEKELVKPLTPTKATGRSVTAACDAFFVAGMHTGKNAAVQMAELAREYVANGAKLLLSAGNLAEDVAVPTHVQRSQVADTVELVRQAELHFVSALRLAPANHAALTLLTEAEKLLVDLDHRSDAADEGIKRTGSGGVKRTTSDAGLAGTADTGPQDISVTAELSMLLAAPDQSGPGAETSEPDSIKTLLAQLKALDRDSSTTQDGAEMAADNSMSSSLSVGSLWSAIDATVPMAQLLLDLQVLELEDELELLSSGTLPTPTGAVATPASVRRSSSSSSSSSSVLCTPKAPEPITEADSVPIDAMDFTTMMASWRLSSSPGAPAVQQTAASSEIYSADCAASPTTSDASRISRSASPSAALEQDIVEFEQQLDSVAAARSPMADSSMLAPCSPPAIIALPRSSGDQMEEELISFCHADSLAAADDEPVSRPAWHLCSPSDVLISPVTAALQKGRGPSLMATAQRRLEMKSERDLMAIEPPDNVVQSVDAEDTVTQHQPAKQPRLNLTHANMPPPPGLAPPGVASTPKAAPSITAPTVLTEYTQSSVCTRTVVPKLLSNSPCLLMFVRLILQPASWSALRV